MPHHHGRLYRRHGHVGPHVHGHGVDTFDAMVNAYSVNRPGEWEVIRQGIYDSAVYAAAGQSILTFFLNPQGAGTGFGGGTKTISDTNMTLAGQIPQNQSFLIQTIEVIFQPTTPTVAAQMPATFGAQAAAAIINDVYIFRRSGTFNLHIGSKDYLTEAPLSKFPPKVNFAVEGALADTTTAAAASQSRIAYATVKGAPYRISPCDLRLEANQNFQATLAWPEGVQVITNPARVFVNLDGLLYRLSQ